MEKIKIYAPVDCTVKKLSELNDGVFSTGMLGDGFYIEPKSQNYLSPIDKGKVSLITETKHAYFFEVNKKNVNILMHIGLESIKLNGTPFDTKVSVGEEVDLKKEIVSVNFKIFEDNQIVKSTPITIEDQDGKIWKFNFTDKYELKQGELIGFFELSKESNDVVISDEIDLQSYFNQEDSYTTLARQINTTVGNKENYEKVYNCMTRLRFKILNKSLVEEEKLRFIKGVKGVIWNGQELQVIIGQDVFKVKDKVVELNKDIVFNTQVKNGKTSLIKKLFGVIGGVMVPLIPVLIGAGLLMGLVSILQISHAMPNIVYQVGPNGLAEGSVLLKDANVFWAILKVISDVPLKFLALLAAISTASYFGYSVFMAGAIGLIIANPILFDGGATTNGPFGIQFGLIDFGSDFKEPFAGFNGIPITGFTNKPFVLILSIYFAFRLDKWLKTKINAQFDTVLRPLIILLVICLATFFIIGPLYYIIEQVITVLIYYLTQTPFGIAQGMLSMFWPLLVMAGMHLPMNVILQVQSNSVGGVSSLLSATPMTQWGCLGALLGLFIISNNAKTKSDAISAAIPGVFGVTEPGIYGVTLPRVKPFIAACLGSGVGGIFIGVLGVQSRVMSGLGVFSYIGMFSDPVMPELAPDNMLSNSTNGSLFILCTMIAMFSAIAFTMLLHTERIKEKNIIKKLNRQLVKLILNENKDKNKYIELKNEFSKIDFELSKEEKNLLKKIEKNILAISNLEEQHSRIINKDNKAKDKMLIEGQKALKNGDSEKTYKIYLKHKQDNSENKKKDILEKINKLKSELNLKEVTDIQDRNYKNIERLLNDIDKKNNFDLKIYLNEYLNATKSLNIYYGLMEPLAIDVSVAENYKKFKESLNKKRKLA